MSRIQLYIQFMHPLHAQVNYMLKAKGMEDKFPLFTAVHNICGGNMKPEELIESLRNHPAHL